MNSDIILGATAGLTHIIAYAIYSRLVFKGHAKPNAATWLLWVLLSFLNLASYFVMTGDWVKIILPVASDTALFTVFFISLFRGKFTRLSRFDWAALFVGITAGLVWWVFRSATYANIILQICFIISFIPTYKLVWKEPGSEMAFPWVLWSSAYIMNLFLVFLRWNDQYQDLVYPIVQFVLHISVALIVLRKSIAKRIAYVYSVI